MDCNRNYNSRLFFPTNILPKKKQKMLLAMCICGEKFVCWTCLPNRNKINISFKENKSNKKKRHLITTNYDNNQPQKKRRIK